MKPHKITSLFSVTLLVCILFASCSQKTTVPDAEHLNVDCEKVMKYVTCPQDTVDKMLNIADSIHSLRNELCSLELLGMDYDDYNHWLDSIHGDTIPLLVSLYASYDAVTTSVSDEISSVFVWHEIAKQQIAFFIGKEPMQEDVEAIFRVMEDVCVCYYGGWQQALNIAARREVMLADYRLIDAYIRLIDKCEDKEIVSLVHTSYKNVLDTYWYIVDHTAGTYSDRPRQMAATFKALMDERRTEIEACISNINYGETVLPAEVKKVLEPHAMEAGLQE